MRHHMRCIGTQTRLVSNPVTSKTRPNYRLALAHYATESATTGHLKAMASGAWIGVGTVYSLGHRTRVPSITVSMYHHVRDIETGIGWLEPGDQGNRRVADLSTLPECSASVPCSWRSH
jgi:hypothetical protein